MKYQFEMLALNIFKGFTLLMPLKLRYLFSDGLAFLSYKLLKSRREVTYKNLKIAFPDYTAEEIHRIAKACYKNMTRNFVETFFMPKILSSGRATVVNEEIVKEAYDQKKGVLLVSLHEGNWEIGAFLGFKGYKMFHIVKRQKNPLFDEYINTTRSAMGVGFIYKGDSVKKIITAIKEGAIISMLSDQYVDDVQVEFFGQKTFAPSGAAVLAIKYNVPILFGYCLREPNNRHKLVAQEILKPVIKENLRESIQATTQLFISKMEEVIRQYPEQWLWQHNRFKER